MCSSRDTTCCYRGHLGLSSNIMHKYFFYILLTPPLLETEVEEGTIDSKIVFRDHGSLPMNGRGSHDYLGHSYNQHYLVSILVILETN